MSDVIRQLDAPSDGARVETGAVQFGNDWPGYFLRGDNAFALFLSIQNYLKHPEDLFARTTVESFAKGLLDSNVNQGLVKQLRQHYGLVAELADAADSKSADADRVGSTPSGPTKPIGN